MVTSKSWIGIHYEKSNYIGRDFWPHVTWIFLDFGPILHLVSIIDTSSVGIFVYMLAPIVSKLSILLVTGASNLADN